MIVILVYSIYALAYVELGVILLMVYGWRVGCVRVCVSALYIAWAVILEYKDIYIHTYK